MPVDTKESMVRVEQEIAKCDRCPDLVLCRKNPVIGRGADRAKVMIIGYISDIEGAEETGSPFSNSPEGELLLQLLEKAGCSLEENTYLTYMIKCVPKTCEHKDRYVEKTNRLRLLGENNVCLLTDRQCTGKIATPALLERENCLHHLSREISVTTPHVLMPLGLEATTTILEMYLSIPPSDKTMRDYHMRVYSSPSFKIVPLYPPELIIQNENIYSLKEYEKDFYKIGKFLEIS